MLTIQFKRFEFGGHGSKITRRVDFDLAFDLAPYMTNSRAGHQMYDLYGVLVHHGHSLHSGHYVCYSKAPNGMWHKFDDSRVTQVSQRQVEGQQAYILFYIRRQPRAGAAAKQPAKQQQQLAVAAAALQPQQPHMNGVAVRQPLQPQRQPQQPDEQQLAARIKSGRLAGPSGQQLEGVRRG